MNKYKIKTIRILLLALALPALTLPAQASLAVKNFRQIYDSLVVSTGVSPTEQTVLDFYTQSYTRLPMTGSIGEVSSPGLLTLTALSSLFCKKMIATDSSLAPAQRRAHQAVDFTKPPSGLTAQIQQSVVEAYFGLFMSRSPSTTELQILKDAFTEAINGLQSNAANTPNALTAVCTSVASSLDSMIL